MAYRRKTTDPLPSAPKVRVSEWFRPHFHIDQLPRLPVPMRGGDPAWKYVSLRRLPVYIEHSIVHGLQWVVFEPNDEPLWALVREQVGEFLTAVWRDDRLVGDKPDDAFFVKCDRTTMTQDDVDSGRLIVLVGIAPLRPAEFVIFRIGLWATGSDD